MLAHLTFFEFFYGMGPASAPTPPAPSRTGSGGGYSRWYSRRTDDDSVLPEWQELYDEFKSAERAAKKKERAKALAAVSQEAVQRGVPQDVVAGIRTALGLAKTAIEGRAAELERARMAYDAFLAERDGAARLARAREEELLLLLMAD